MSKLQYDPTPEEIQAQLAEIRARWGPRTELARRGVDPAGASWTVPIYAVETRGNEGVILTPASR